MNNHAPGPDNPAPLFSEDDIARWSPSAKLPPPHPLTELEKRTLADLRTLKAHRESDDRFFGGPPRLSREHQETLDELEYRENKAAPFCSIRLGRPPKLAAAVWTHISLEANDKLAALSKALKIPRSDVACRALTAGIDLLLEDTS